MSDPVRRLILNISDSGTAALFSNAQLARPARGDKTQSRYRSAVLDAVGAASDEIRNRIEAISGEVVGFSDKTVFAEMALKAASDGSVELSEIQNMEASLVERALLTLLRAPERFQRARNLAAGFHWREGRYHRGFVLRDAGDIKLTALEEIGRKIAHEVHKRQGGKKASSEAFTYAAPQGVGDPDAVIHHVAVYVESPAISSVEFRGASDEISRVVRRPAKEIAIDYNSSTGRLDIAGYGIGGGAVLEDVAEVFRQHAVENGELHKIEHRRSHLDQFAAFPVALPHPPDGTTSVAVHELQLHSQRKPRGRATITAAPGQSVYDRMGEIGINPTNLAFEQVRAVTFEFVRAAAPQEEATRFYATLTWPGSLTFENASVAERRLGETWLVVAGYYDPLVAPLVEEPVAV